MEFDFTVETSRDIDEVVSSLEEALQQDGFGVLWDFDLTGKLQEKGMDFNTPFRILEVCNPKEADRILKENKMVGYFLPCKIVVYEDSGQTKVGMPKPTALINLADDQSLNEIAMDVEKRLIHSIERAISLDT
ncbi:DUF302 domain-containing protein [Bacillus taeanensis]|uniref:DUF302 domain-containing protein n=1 Tax=Bacillus taeanensis TaxID=273032 RepID=A0A366XW89_9BACI|nr:DUF302 domain-containing protein [Bacillus taeanensis]RBW70167.1 DUF302 domain-containing protein [Bacillus taeanensis]